MAGPPRGTPARRQFPALDPEPPPGPWWHRLLRPAAVLALAGLVLAVIWLVPFSALAGHHGGRSARGAAAAPPVRAGGHIVAVDPRGVLVTADPDGRRPHRLGGLGVIGTAVAAAPDNRYLALLNGQLISMKPGAVLASYPARVPLSDTNTAALPNPFADHDRVIVRLADYGDQTASAQNPISVAEIATGRSVSLGTGDAVAGDPAAPGVFAGLEAPPQATAAALRASPDRGIVLRDEGHPAVQLATAATLNRAIGLAAADPVVLVPYPSPSGAEVAVSVQPAAGGQVAGIVVLSRSGRLLAHVHLAGSAAPAPAQGIPVWSPSGGSLAYLRPGTRPELDVWQPGGTTIYTTALPGGGSYGSCVWSPDSRSVLCPLVSGRRTTWLVTRATGGRPAVASGTGLPVAWLP